MSIAYSARDRSYCCTAPKGDKQRCLADVSLNGLTEVTGKAGPLPGCSETGRDRQVLAFWVPEALLARVDSGDSGDSGALQSFKRSGVKQPR